MNSDSGGPRAEGRGRITKAGLACWLVLSAFLALFPVGWLGENWPAFGRWLGWVFATAWAHAAGHMLIFLLLGLAALFAHPALQARPSTYFGLMCAAAALQETLQLVYKQRRPEFDDFRDLLTNLIGISLAFVTVRYLLPLLKPVS